MTSGGDVKHGDTGREDGTGLPPVWASSACVSGGAARSPGGLGWWRTFGGLLRFEALRLRHSRGFWGWAVLLVLLASLSLHSGGFGLGSATTTVFVMCIAIPLLCANDLDSGALKNVLVGGHARSAYVAVMMVLAVLLSLVLLALWWLFAILTSWVGWRADGALTMPEDPVLWVAATLACVVAAVAPALFVAILTRSQPLATIVALLIVSHVPGALLHTGLREAGFRDLATLVWHALPIDMVGRLASGDLPVGITPWIVSLATAALFCGLSLWAMGRRDVSVCDE